MWAKVALFALIAIVARSGANDVDEEVTNSNVTKWYSKDVQLYDNMRQSRVIDGQPAQRRQLPWHCLITVETGTGFFTSGRLIAGSLISSTFVLTEANALRGGAGFEVVLGAHTRSDRRNVRRSTRAILHPNHVAGEGNWNVGLLELARAFTDFSKYVRPVQLAAADSDYIGRYAWISGFGASSKCSFYNLFYCLSKKIS